MSKIKDYIIASDNAADYSDKLIEDLQQKALEDIDDLFTSSNNRDEILWQSMDVDTELVLKDYNDQETKDRGINWVLGLAGLAAAAGIQFFLDNREETIIKPIAYKVQKLGGFNLTRDELIQAGKRSFKVVSSQEYEILQNRIISQFDWVRRLDNSELYTILINNNSLKPAEQYIPDAIGYVTRMTNYPPDSVQFKTAVNDLISSNSSRSIKSNNRRTVQQLYTERQLDGDYNKEMVWVLEPGNNCENCLAFAGQVRPFSEWQQIGQPGYEVCLGGGYCNCFLESYR